MMDTPARYVACTVELLLRPELGIVLAFYLMVNITKNADWLNPQTASKASERCITLSSAFFLAACA